MACSTYDFLLKARMLWFLAEKITIRYPEH